MAALAETGKHGDVEVLDAFLLGGFAAGVKKAGAAIADVGEEVM